MINLMVTDLQYNIYFKYILTVETIPTLYNQLQLLIYYLSDEFNISPNSEIIKRPK